MIGILVWIVAISSLQFAEGSLSLESFQDGNGTDFLDFNDFLELDETDEQSASAYAGPLTCGYMDIYWKFSGNCRLSYLTRVFRKRWSNGVITGKELLEQLSYTCSKYDSYQKCAHCTLGYECPEEKDLLSKSVMEEWSVFCNKDQVSGWLVEILQNGYSYNTSLHWRVTYQSFWVCFDKLQESEDRYNTTALMQMSMSEGLDYYRTITSILFKCTVGEILARADPKEECNTSWQDIVLTFWLDFTTSVRHGLNINEEEIKLLQAMRC